jgi:molecular chaperone DnaK (HSP70)
MNILNASKDQLYSFIIGIDLGTTNSAVAFIDLTKEKPQSGNYPIQFLEIPQLVAPEEIANRPVLPSFLYLPGQFELPQESISLPWDRDRNYVLAEFAREQGASVPNRLVSSAKSWLCHAGVNRTDTILPWGAKEDIPQVSPVEASSRYLQHIREAWDYRISNGKEELAFDQQLIVLTVPASFDEVARELTIAAAQKAGINRLVLVEEPLAAFYAWLSKNEDSWQDEMQEGQLILVCDVGGGTTDFSIIGISEGEKGLRFNRLAVGEHLMLGGDNMDLALGRYLESKVLGQPGKLDYRRWHQLVHQCRKAKENLLVSGDQRTRFEISVTGTSGKLIADTFRASISHEEIQKLIVDGFYPVTNLKDKPGEGRRAGLTELGLPYVQDPAITRHLSAFWQKFNTLLKKETAREQPYPDFVLFNGGALSPQPLRKHLQHIIGKWFENHAGNEWVPIELDNPRPDLSVAMGAAYYGLVRLGEGVRVGSGSPRAYYVEISRDEQQKILPAVCLIPRGTEEGFEIQLDKPDFEVLANQPVAFQMVTSSTRLGDKLGEVVTLMEDEITVLPQIQTVLRFGKRGEARKLPVHIAVKLTEIGTLELWCQSKETEHRWQLRFDVRQEAKPGETQSVSETIDEQLINEAQKVIRQTFQYAESGVALPPERLTRNLVEILEMKKEKWPTPIIRKLVDTLLEFQEGRKLSAQHEARWLNLYGYCMRPGFGDPVDEWRMKKIWSLHFQGIKFEKQDQTRNEWWIFWRRVAGGLTAGKQQQIFQQVNSQLQSRVYPKKSAKRLNPHEELEIWMAMANFERLPVDAKIDLGQLLLEKIEKSKPKPQELWALGRIGSRTPFYGPLNQLLPAEQVESWLRRLFAIPIETTDANIHAIIQLARTTGDRSRDISELLRNEVIDWFGDSEKADYYKELLLNPESATSQAEQDWAFGESLPSGLVLEKTG